MVSIPPLTSLQPGTFETPAIFRATVTASRRLAELKGMAETIPNQEILVSTLSLQEARDSSAIENIVTTQDDLFRAHAFPEASSGAAKEVRHYAHALRTGWERVRANGLLTNTHVLEMQAIIEGNDAGFRRTAGTVLKDAFGRMVYTPPQDPAEVRALMADLESFVNDDGRLDADPLVKMAVIHHQFESIHPFQDGNGRTGRLVNVLYLVRCGLLDAPLLYPSRFILHTRADYYRLLQQVRADGRWEEWTLYMLASVEESAVGGIRTIAAIREALLEYKHRIREKHRFYSQDLVNNLFEHPYTRIELLMKDLGVSRLTATRYLDLLAEDGLLRKQRVGRANYYANVGLVEVLARAASMEDAPS